MNNQLAILLVEADKCTCEEIAHYISEINDINLVETTDSSINALEAMANYLPEAVILDLELIQGDGNGIQFLVGLKKLKLQYHPYILITTNNSSLVTLDFAHKLGADFIISKHQPHYSAKNVVDFLRTLKPAIISNLDFASAKLEITDYPKKKTNLITRQIITELNLLGINPKYTGYQYLIDAITMLIENRTNNLCAIIGKKHRKTAASVERAMQNVIDRTWQTYDIGCLIKNYKAKINPEKGKPTMTEFIFYYANKIKNGL